MLYIDFLNLISETQFQLDPSKIKDPYLIKEFHRIFHYIHPTIYSICLENNVTYVDLARMLNIKFGLMYNSLIDCNDPVYFSSQLTNNTDNNFSLIQKSRDFYFSSCPTHHNIIYFEIKNYVFTVNGFSDYDFYKIYSHIDIESDSNMRLIIDGSTQGSEKAIHLHNRFINFHGRDSLTQTLVKHGKIVFNTQDFLNKSVLTGIVKGINAGKIRLLRF